MEGFFISWQISLTFLVRSTSVRAVMTPWRPPRVALSTESTPDQPKDDDVALASCYIK
jgi:hypothetical protein